MNLQVDEYLLASLKCLGARISIASFVDATLKGEGDGQEKEHIGEVKYRTFGYFDPNVKSMIIIVIFTHREIRVGYVLSLHNQLKIPNDVDTFMYCLFGPNM